MKVIIKKTNQVKDVAFGYAVNYLIPQDLAVKATSEELKKRAAKQKRAKDNQLAIKKQQQQLVKNLHKKIIIKARTGKNNKLFGSIGKKEILKSLKLQKTEARVILKEPIKKLGNYNIELKIGAERIKINLTVK